MARVSDYTPLKQSEWEAYMEASQGYILRYVVTDSGEVYPAAYAVERGLDGWPMCNATAAVRLAQLLRIGDTEAAERLFVRHHRQRGSR